MSRSIKMRTVIDRAQDTVRGFLAWGTRREFAFRMRFVVAPRSGISDARERVPLQSSGRMRVVLKAANDKDDLTTSRDWVVEGWGFRNEETAVEAGDRWREVLEIAFAKIRIAADFGDRVPGGGVFTAAGTEWLRKLFGVPQHVPILNDRHG